MVPFPEVSPPGCIEQAPWWFNGTCARLPTRRFRIWLGINYGKIFFFSLTIIRVNPASRKEYSGFLCESRQWGQTLASLPHSAVAHKCEDINTLNLYDFVTSFNRNVSFKLSLSGVYRRRQFLFIQENTSMCYILSQPTSMRVSNYTSVVFIMEALISFKTNQQPCAC